MKLPRFFYTLCLTLIIYAACTSGKNHKKNDEEVKSPAHENLSDEKNFYRQYAGTVEGRNVVVNIQRINGDFYNCNYYFEGTGNSISLSQDSVSSDTYYFSEYTNEHSELDIADDNVSLPQWQVSFHNDSVVGSLLSADRNQKLPVLLKESNSEYVFSMLSVFDSARIFPKKDSSPLAYVGIASVVPEGTKDSGFLNNQLKKMLGTDSSLSIQNGLQTGAEKYLNDNKLKDEIDSSDEDLNEPANSPTSLNYVGIAYNARGYVNFCGFGYYFLSGAAHGMYEYGYTCLDVQGRKVLTLKDIFNTDTITVHKLIEDQFREQSGLKPSEPLDSSDILLHGSLFVTDNFYFVDGGIIFVYNPYEIASYATGVIKICIRFDKIKNYLTPDFKTRMSL